MRKYKFGEAYDEEKLDFPTVDDGVKGMALVKAVVSSTAKGNQWVSTSF